MGGGGWTLRAEVVLGPAGPRGPDEAGDEDGACNPQKQNDKGHSEQIILYIYI